MRSLRPLLIATPLLLFCSAQARANPLCDEPRQRGERVATLSEEDIDESSGLAASWLSDDLLWTHNDSGDAARLWAFQKDGQVVTELRLTSIDADDWEDLAIAPCSPESPDPCLYIADIGDNLSERETVTIYRVPEPDLGQNPPETLEIEEVDALEFRYEGGPRNAEALLVHPESAKIWVIEKTDDPLARVFSVPAQFGAPEVQEAKSIATIQIPGAIPLLRYITAADIAPDASQFTLRTYLEIYTFCADGDDFETAFAANPVRTTVAPATIQGEALTYDRKDWSIWLTSEQLPTPLIRIPPPDSADVPNDDKDEQEKESAVEDADVEGAPPAEQTRRGCSTSTPQTPGHRYLFTTLFAIFFITRQRSDRTNDG